MDYDRRTPIYLQVIDSIQKRLVKGEIKAGDKLPSTRALALEYEVNPNTAARIYKEMEAMGLCYTERGLGTFVSKEPHMIDRIRREMAGRLTRDYVREMNEIGFDKEKMLESIKEEIETCST